MRRALLIGATMLLFAATAQAQPRRAARFASAAVAIAAGNLPGCVGGTLRDPRPIMQNFGATILRVVITPGYGLGGEALPCITAAQSEGYRVMLVIQWDSEWPLPHTELFFTQVLTEYGPYLWAVGIGNEQEIAPRLNGYGYALVWQAVEPIVELITPQAIRVGGEISPWGLQFLRHSLRWGLTGIQAIAVHPYSYSWAFTVKRALKLAQRWGLPLWCDEGLRDGPYSWHWRRTVPLSAMQGVAVAGVWEGPLR